MRDKLRGREGTRGESKHLAGVAATRILDRKRVDGYVVTIIAAKSLRIRPLEQGIHEIRGLRKRKIHLDFGSNCRSHCTVNYERTSSEVGSNWGGSNFGAVTSVRSSSGIGRD